METFKKISFILLSIICLSACTSDSLSKHTNCGEVDLDLRTEDYPELNFSLKVPNEWATGRSSNKGIGEMSFSGYNDFLLDEHIKPFLGHFVTNSTFLDTKNAQDSTFMEKSREKLSQITGFEKLHVIQENLPDKFNLSNEFNKERDRLTSYEYSTTLGSGDNQIDGLSGKWLLSDSVEFSGTDSMSVRELFVLMPSDKHYYEITASVYGNEKVEERMCQMMESVYSFKERD